MLPADFTYRMKQLLGAEYPAFLDSYDKEQYKALRLNPLKTDKAQFLVHKEDLQPEGQTANVELKSVPWEENGYYYTSHIQPGKHPYHDAGVYYIQEPSAMAPVGFLKAKPGERILDLCAAPGGKSTQIAGYMKGRGLLVCNEIHPARAKILSENIERLGVQNAIVTNETPQGLQAAFNDYFDRILVDAPCSGEGMFRKNEEAFTEWSLENVQMCAKRQDEILDCADAMLRPGGRLVYSTCTFAPLEDEGSISRFLDRHPEYSVAAAERAQGMSEGVPEWNPAKPDDCLKDRSEELKKTVRLWPHLLDGEGHYAAILEKGGCVPSDFKGYSRYGVERGISPREYQEYLEFQKQFMKIELSGVFLKFGDQLYLAPEGTPSLKGLKVLRPGLHLGTFLKNRFEPSHALALALKPDEAVYTVDLSMSSKETGAEVYQYLNGLTLNRDGDKGWYLVCVDGYSLGWGKLAGGILKNHYPKGLRKK